MIIVLLLLTLVAAAFAHVVLKKSRFPPGPFPLPLIGSIPYIAYLSYKNAGIVGALQLLKKKYGPVFTVWFGPMPTVHITDLEIAQDAMVKHGANYSDRWAPLLFDLLENGMGLIISNGRLWLEQRRFSLHILRNFGFGRSLIEGRIMEEFYLKFDEIDRQIKKTGSNVIDPHLLVELLIGSIINRILFSEGFDSSSDHFFAMKRSVDKTLNKLSIFDLFIYECMLIFPPIRKRYDQILEPFYQLKDYIRKQLEKRKREINKGSHVLEGEGCDYVDAYFIKMAEEMKGNPKDSVFTEEALLINLLDLWIAGQETTTTTILSGLINLICYPEVAQNIREEIKKVTDNKRPLSLLDRPATPYLVATTVEIQRLASIISLNLWRRSSEDSIVGGHQVPGGTTIAAQLSVLLSDPKYFDDPDKFDPTRYLKEKGLEKHVIPFGIGKRSCLGESLAKAEIYLIIGNLLQRYQLSAVDGQPSREPKTPYGVVRLPKPFMLSLSKIKNV